MRPVEGVESGGGSGDGGKEDEDLVCYHPTKTTSPAVFATASFTFATPVFASQLRNATRALCAAVLAPRVHHRRAHLVLRLRRLWRFQQRRRPMLRGLSERSAAPADPGETEN